MLNWFFIVQSGLLLRNIIKIKQATIPLGTKRLSNPPNESGPGFSRNCLSLARKNVDIAELDAGHSVDGTLLFRAKFNELWEALL